MGLVPHQTNSENHFKGRRHEDFPGLIPRIPRTTPISKPIKLKMRTKDSHVLCCFLHFRGNVRKNRDRQQQDLKPIRDEEEGEAWHIHDGTLQKKNNWELLVKCRG